MSYGPTTTPTGGGNSRRKPPLIDVIRASLAIIVVGSFMAVTVTMLLYALFSKDKVDLAAYATFFSQTSSVYTGIVGVVVGYYFGRSQERSETGNTSAEAQRQTSPGQGGGQGQASGAPVP
jgi:hypothetical protein